MMPSLAGLRTVVERLKALDTHVTVAGNRSGQLQLVVQNDNLHLDTLYNKLVNPQLGRSLHGDTLTSKHLSHCLVRQILLKLRNRLPKEIPSCSPRSRLMLGI